jgi:aminoglycoside phosphotransferase (APT) family kinase protein
MSQASFTALAAPQREAAHSALAAAFGAAPVGPVTPVSGGASGAAIFRVEVGGRPYLLRVEGPAGPLLRRNPHRHACARLAAEAGLAPKIHVLDETNGVMLSDFVERRPLRAYPGGPLALARALGALLSRLQAGPAFPQLVYYPDLVSRMFDQMCAAGAFADGLADAHAERLAALRSACDWDAAPAAASHNDPNRGNILFDGERLWLIDWESAYRNHPLVDVAIVLDGLAPAPDLEEALLSAWLGRAPDAEVRAGLALMRPLTRLYYACFLLGAGSAARSAPETDLSPPDPAALRRALADGRLRPDAPQTALALGKLYLDAFLADGPAPGLTAAVAAVIGD